MSTAGLVTVVAVLVVVGVVGLLLRRRSGRVRAPRDAVGTDGWTLVGVLRARDERFLLLQLSSPVCAPCRTTAGVLAGLVADDPRLRHVEVDVAERMDVARALGVLSIPTTVAFDQDGIELLRVSGVPRAGELRAALGA